MLKSQIRSNQIALLFITCTTIVLPLGVILVWGSKNSGLLTCTSSRIVIYTSRWRNFLLALQTPTMSSLSFNFILVDCWFAKFTFFFFLIFLHSRHLHFGYLCSIFFFYSNFIFQDWNFNGCINLFSYIVVTINFLFFIIPVSLQQVGGVTVGGAVAGWGSMLHAGVDWAYFFPIFFFSY